MDESASAILERLSEAVKGRVRFALAFGSLLGPSFNAESDVDLAVFPIEYANGKGEMTDLRHCLGGLTNRDLDIIDLSTADPIIIMQVLANGRLIYAADTVEFYLFKSRKISEYFDFKRARRVAEDAILKRRIYA